MGRGTWWLPRWLSKVVPHVDIEGRAITEAQRASARPAPAAATATAPGDSLPSPGSD